jgi:hypothetical protein
MRIRILLALLILASTNIWAGSHAANQATLDPERIATFSKNVEKYAASQGARAFIIARIGRPKKDLPKGINYTHTAIAIYSNIQLSNGETVQGYAIHNLYQLEGRADRSKLVVDYPVDFFWGAQDLQAGIIIPSHEVQMGLIDLIDSGKAAQLHNPNYSVIANPFNNLYQNCTEYTLDLINAAIYQTTDIKRIKAAEKSYFSAQPLNINGFKLALGSLFMDDVTTKDHTDEIQTTSFTSIYKYLTKYKLVELGVSFNEQQEVIAL